MAEAVAQSATDVNVLIEVGDCIVSILPQFGGKVASITVRGSELLQTPLLPYGPRTKTMPFWEADASGWDECLPSVGGCTIDTPAGKAEVPDHGDLWRVEWDVLKQSDNSITLRGDCFSMPLSLERTITVTETAKGYRIQADYKLTNTGSVELPWAWSAHPGYLAEEGDTIELPESIKELRVEWSNFERLGKPGSTTTWPIAKLTTGGEVDQRITQPEHSGVGDKLFAGPLQADQAWIALNRPKAGVRLLVSFDPAKTPYLGMWVCQDGYPDPGKGELKQHCVAMEPCTAPVDTLSIEGPWSLKLGAGKSYTWPMTLDLEKL